MQNKIIPLGIICHVFTTVKTNSHMGRHKTYVDSLLYFFLSQNKMHPLIQRYAM